MTAPQSPDSTDDQRPDDPASLWAAWHRFACRPEVDDRIEALYADLDARVRARGPTCWTSGKCCNFDEYGHRLYVTGLEIAWVLRRWERREAKGLDGAESGNREDGSTGEIGPIIAPDSRESAASGSSGRSLSLLIPKATGSAKGPCRFQVDKLCGIHSIRPMGCRVFFCQEGTSQWQHELYEEFLKELRGIHDALGVEYRYMEWRAGLDQAITLRKATS